MTTETKQYTVNEIRDNFAAALKRIKTGVLKDTLEDRAFIERVVTQFILVRKLEPTEENFYAAFKANLKVLPWLVKPAALLAAEAPENNNRPVRLENSEKALQPLLDKKAAAEKAEAKAKTDEASVKQAKELIASYFPTRMGRADYRDQEQMQTEWTAALNKAITMKVNLQDWVRALNASIRKRYADREGDSGIR